MVLLWTINDFFTYSNLFGHTTRGYYACPICNENICSPTLEHRIKWFIVDIGGFFLVIMLCKSKKKKKKKIFNSFQEFQLALLPMTGV